jgi:DnaK suppressor protein
MRESIVNENRARQLVALERIRVQGLLAQRVGEVRADGPLQNQQTGENHDNGSALESEAVAVALAADLREQLAAVDRAEGRISQGTFGRSVVDGTTIPDERLEAEPLAERTIEQQHEYEANSTTKQMTSR